MNSTTVITIAIAVLAVLGLGVVLTATRRSDMSGVGVLSRETRKRDRDAKKSSRSARRDVEAEASAARSTAVAVMPPAAVEPWVAPDAEMIGESRRAFLNRATGTLMSASLGGFAAALIAFLWKGADSGFGSKINAGKLEDVISQIRASKGFLYLPEARAWVTEYPKEAISKADAIAYFKEKGDEYKLELLEGLDDGTITFYTQGEFTDLCRGPHIPNTGFVKAVKLTSIAGAYWRGDEKNKQLTRIDGITFPKQAELTAYLERVEEAKRRDHRKLGKELELFNTGTIVK